MTKRRDLIKNISNAAKASGTAWDLVREGANHSVYRLGTVTIPVPRHNEIQENTTRAIYRECEEILGKDWWK